MLLVALSIAGESRSLKENLSQKESLEGRLPYVEQIRKAECDQERLTRMERQMTYYQGQLPIRVSKERKQFQEQLIEYKSQLRDKEAKLENVETQLRELQEKLTNLEERKPRETCNLQDELETKRKELNELQTKLSDREQDIVRLKRDLLDKDTKLDNAQTQLRELQEEFTILKEQEGEKCNLQDQLINKREELDELERVLRDREQDIVQQKRDLIDRETKMFRENVQTQLRELQEKFTILEEHKLKEKETCNLQDELKIKRKELNELERELRDREQDIVQLKRDLLDRERKLDNVQTQLREQQEKFTILEEHKERETRNLQDELKIKREELDKLERELRDREQDIVELRRDLNEANETKSKYELQLKTRDWILSRDEVELTEKRLGEGAFGIVLEGRYCDCPVAVKKLRESILTPQALSLFEREMDIASRCRHPCLLLFIGATKDENSRPLFVTELMDLSLRALLRKRQLSETEVSVISLDVARALEYLHRRKPSPIVHRDVSSANVLLWKQNDQWRGKLSDYGTANFVAEIMTTNPGAAIYEAPESGSSNYQTEVGLST